MRSNIKYLHDTLEEVFSLVPTQDAIASSRAIVEQHLRNDTSISSNIKWAEFSTAGQFVRGGVSRVDLMSSQLVSNWHDDDAIAEIVTHASEIGIKAGQLIPATTVEGYYWCVPYTPSDQKEVPTTRLRTILLTEDLFTEILNLFNQDADLSTAEKHIVFQVVTGLNARDAAIVDNVSIETKRSQLKKASSKLSCSGQPELVRLLMGQMVHILYLCDAEVSHIKMTERFTTEVLGERARLSVQRLPNGRLMRFWELGPAAGRPLLVIHGYLFPFLLLNAQRQLEKHNLRLIIPVRSGYLDGQSGSGDYQEGTLSGQTIEDIEQFVQLQWNEAIPIMGHATGGAFAMLNYHRQPALFSSIIIVSLNLLHSKKRPDSMSSRFLGGIYKLAKDRGLLEAMTRQFQKTAFSSERTTRFVLRRLFKDCAGDLRALDGVDGADKAYNWYRMLHAHSTLGISSDFELISGCDDSLVQDIGIPMTFIQGESDPFTSVSEISNFIKPNPRAKLVTIPKGGHLVCASNPELVWDQVNISLQL